MCQSIQNEWKCSIELCRPVLIGNGSSIVHPESDSLQYFNVGLISITINSSYDQCREFRLRREIRKM